MLGGLTLIDEEPDYLSIAPDLTFRSRSRYLDDVTGEWVSETEVIESASELVELYNPADIYAAFAEAAREAAGMPPSRPLKATSSRSPASRPRRASRSARTRTPRPPTRGRPASRCRSTADDDESAARRLYDLALEYQERSQRSEARLLDEFEGLSAGLIGVIGDMIIVDDDDERLSLTGRRSTPRSSPRMPRASGGRSAAPRSWSSSTTRPTSSATWPTRWPRPSRPSRRSSRTRRTAPGVPTKPPPRSPPGRGRGRRRPAEADADADDAEDEPTA